MFLLQLVDEDTAPQSDPSPPDLPHVEEDSIVQGHHLSLNALRGAGGLGTISFTG